MKRLLLAAALAVGLHGFLLVGVGGRSTLQIPSGQKQEPVSVTLDFSASPPADPGPAPGRDPLPREAEPLAQLSPEPISQLQESVRPEQSPLELTPRQEKKPVAPERSKAPPDLVKSVPAPLPTAVPAAVSAEKAARAAVRETQRRPGSESSPPPAAEESSPSGPAAESGSEASSGSPVSAGEPTVETLQLARPLYRNNPPPVYPPLAKRRRYEGTVLLEALVDEEGRVDKLEVAESSGYNLLDRAALKTVRDWRFEPGRRRGRPEAMWVMVPVRFELTD